MDLTKNVAIMDSGDRQTHSVWVAIGFVLLFILIIGAIAAAIHSNRNGHDSIRTEFDRQNDKGTAAALSILQERTEVARTNFGVLEQKLNHVLEGEQRLFEALFPPRPRCFRPCVEPVPEPA